MTLNPFLCIDLSISDSLRSVRKSVLIYETIIVDEWERNSKFEIGDPIYFEQIIDFKNVGPYNTIYEYDGRSFSIAARRR
jgi:hypothetical protein